MSAGAENTGLPPVTEVIKPPTVSEVGQPPASLADNLEKMTEVNPHQALKNLANNSPLDPNLIIDAQGTAPINEAPGIPAVGSLTEVTDQSPKSAQPQPEQDIGPTSGVQSEGVQQPQPESTDQKSVPKQQDTTEAEKPADVGLLSEKGQVKAEIETPSTMQKEGTETPESRQQRITELQKKITDGTVTPDELKEYRNLKQQENPEVRRKVLKEKILKGDFTDEVAAEFIELLKSEGRQEENHNPQAELEKINQEIEELGVKILRGEGDRVENIVRLQQLRYKALGVKPEISEERARQLVRDVLNPDRSISRKTTKEIALQREIKRKLEQLMALEMQVLMAPQRLKALKRKAEEIKNKIAVTEEQTKGVIGMNNEKTFEERMKLYPLYMQLANVKAEIVNTKMAIPILIGQYKDIMQYVRRKLGITNVFTAFLEWAEAKLFKTAIDLYVDNASLADTE